MSPKAMPEAAAVEVGHGWPWWILLTGYAARQAVTPRCGDQG